MICDTRSRLLAQLARIVRDYGDDPVTGGLRAVEAMQLAGMHWPDLLPPIRGGFRIHDIAMLDLIGVAVGYGRHFTPYELATLVVIAAKPSSIACKGYIWAPVPEHGQEDRKLILEMIEAAELRRAGDTLPARPFGVL